jgi:hypothetical protein
MPSRPCHTSAKIHLLRIKNEVVPLSTNSIIQAKHHLSELDFGIHQIKRVLKLC